jgi:heme O synthase-like polyprenyltransferase
MLGMVEVGTAVFLLRIGMVPAVNEVEAAMEAETALLCAIAAVAVAVAVIAAAVIVSTAITAAVVAATFLTLSSYRVEGEKSVHASHAFCVVTTYLSAQISIDTTDAKAFFSNLLSSTVVDEAGKNSLGVRIVVHCC